MKNNTNKLKTYLNQAFQAIPNDFALTEVKSLLFRAIQVVEVLEQKRSGREEDKNKRKQKLPLFSANPLNSLKVIENELAAEKNKLKDVKNRSNQLKLNDEENGLENVFG